MQPSGDDVERLRPPVTRRVVMAIGIVSVVIVIAVIVVINPSGSPAQPGPTPLVASAVPPFSTWVSFTSPEGRLSASFPGQPDHSSLPVTIAGAKVTSESFEWTTGDNAMRFDIVYMDYPAGALSTLSPETIFADLEGTFTASGGKILASRVISGRYPGHEFTVSRHDEQTTFRAWIAGDRAYQVGATGGSPDTAAFLDAFGSRLSNPTLRPRLRSRTRDPASCGQPFRADRLAGPRRIRTGCGPYEGGHRWTSPIQTRPVGRPIRRAVGRAEPPGDQLATDTR